jgi:hypothetical protein
MCRPYKKRPDRRRWYLKQWDLHVEWQIHTGRKTQKLDGTTLEYMLAAEFILWNSGIEEGPSPTTTAIWSPVKHTVPILN